MSLDPRTRLALLVALSVAVLCLDGAAPLCVAAAVPLAGALAQPRMAGWRLRFVLLAAAIVWSTVLSQALFWRSYPRTPVQIGPLVVWREGALHGLVQSLRFLALTAGGLWVSLSTAPDRLVAAMLALRVPYGLALMATSALRFVPAVGREVVEVRRARARRGRPAWRRSPAAWVRLEAELLVPALARAVRRAQAMAETLDARGLHPTAPRAVRVPMRLTRVDVVLLGLTAVCTAAAVLARALYVLYTLELWYHPSLRGLYGFVRGWM